MKTVDSLPLMQSFLVRYSISKSKTNGGFRSLTSSLGLHKSSGQYRFNTVQQTYNNYVGSASSFLVVQIGICTFHWSSTAKRYFAKPFNFYIFPRGSRGRSLNRNFLVQSTAFDFLAGVGFDFNKVWLSNFSPVLFLQVLIHLAS